MAEDGDDEDEQVILVPKMSHKTWDKYAGKLHELKKRQDVVITALSVPAFFALAKCNCPSGFVAAFDEEQQGFASSCDAWFVFGVAGLAMVPCTGTGAAAKAAHALECVNVFGNFVNELSPRSPRFDEFASGSGLSSWKGGGDAGVGRAATLLDSAAEAHERAKGKRPAGVNASTINNPKTRAAAQEAMDDPYSGVAGPERGEGDAAYWNKMHKIADDKLEKLRGDKDPVYKELMESQKRLALLSQKPALVKAVVTASKHATLAACRDLDAGTRGDNLQLAQAAIPSGKGLTASELLDTLAYGMAMWEHVLGGSVTLFYLFVDEISKAAAEGNEVNSATFLSVQLKLVALMVENVKPGEANAQGSSRKGSGGQRKMDTRNPGTRTANFFTEQVCRAHAAVPGSCKYKEKNGKPCRFMPQGH